jgi:hypothetical protein
MAENGPPVPIPYKNQLIIRASYDFDKTELFIKDYAAI